MAVINPMSTDPLDPFTQIRGRQVFIPNPPIDDDLQADDWDPCDIAGEAPGTDWSGILAIGIGRVRRAIARGDQCDVRLDGLALRGDWKLAWMQPDEFWLWDAAGEEPQWPTAHALVMLPRMVVSGNGHNVPLRLHRVTPWHSENGRLYRLMVTLDQQ